MKKKEISISRNINLLINQLLNDGNKRNNKIVSNNSFDASEYYIDNIFKVNS